MEVPTPIHLKDLDVDDATFCPPDVTAFCRLDDLGLVVVGQYVTDRCTVLECRVVPVPGDEFCRACGAEGVVRGTVTRRLAHEPFGWRPTTLLVRVRLAGADADSKPCSNRADKASVPISVSERRGFGRDDIVGRGAAGA